MTGRTRSTAPAILTAIAAAVMFLLAGCGDRPAADKQVIILGFDGMDPKLCEQMLNEGRLPALARLRDAGGFRSLGTSTPPQSPVAWSTFITGANPGEHGIFDFIHRHAETYRPYDSTAETKAGGWPIHLGRWIFYLKAGEVLNLRKGKPFWEHLTEAGVPAQIYHIPAIYPPAKAKGAPFCCLTDMGTPDIRGSKGEFSLYTTGPARKISGGGHCYHISIKNGVGRGAFYGPPDGMLAPPEGREANTKPTETPFTLYRDPVEPTIRIVWQNQEVLLSEGEWSDWCPVEFKMGPQIPVGGGETTGLLPGSTAASICRFLLKQVRPFLELYVTPFNIDPLNPSLPISVPDDFATEVAEHIGRHYTQGLPQDTKALSHGILTTDEFLQQADIVRRERLRMLDYALDHFECGVMFFYFGGTDMVAHMFWGARCPDHPALTEEEHQKYKGVVDGTYLEMDRVVGKVMDRFPEATIIVMSDHGFETFTRQFNPNNWLLEHDYTVKKDPEAAVGTPLNIDFANSRAYAMGINGLYINLEGREGQGIVPPAQKQALMDEIAADMLEYRDPKTGKPVIKEMYQCDKVYSGPNVDIGPDIQIGYDRTFRGSWNAGLGGFDRRIMSDNTDAWCADHCIATDLVPGVLFANRPIVLEDPDLMDLGPTVLAEFGVQVPAQMHGRSVFRQMVGRVETAGAGLTPRSGGN